MYGAFIGHIFPVTLDPSLLQTLPCCLSRLQCQQSSPRRSTPSWAAPSSSPPTFVPSSSGRETTSEDKDLKILFHVQIWYFISVNIFCDCFWIFCVRSTKRVDHSNTRLASQLDRNPGEGIVIIWSDTAGCYVCKYEQNLIISHNKLYLYSRAITQLQRDLQ